MKRLLLALAACGLLSASAHAAPLSYTGIINVEIGRLSPIPLPGSGVASVTGGGTFTIPAGVPGTTGFAGATTILLTATTPNGATTTPNFPLVQLIVAGASYDFTSHTMMSAYGAFGPYPCPGTSFCTMSGTSAVNLAGAFGPGLGAYLHTGMGLKVGAGGGTGMTFGAGVAGGGFGGGMGINGVALVGALGSPGAPSANIAVGLSIVGVGGNITTVDPVVGFVQVAAGPWTNGTATVFGLFEVTNSTPNGATTMASVTKLTRMGTGATPTTAAASGMLTLVTPIYINTAAAGLIPAFGTLVLNIVPEPGTLLLLASGVIGLTVIGSRRRS